MNIPDSIYQYMSISKCFSILRNTALPLRNFLSYNDPFECLPEFVEFAPIQALCKSANEEERRYIIRNYLLGAQDKYRLTDSFIQGVVDGIVSTGILKYNNIPIIGAYVVIAGITYLYSHERRGYPDEINTQLELFYHKYFGELSKIYTSCFTTSMDNLLMWSHYAQSHYGVVMEFDSKKIPFSDGIFQQVDYRKSSRFDFGVDDLTDNDKIAKSVKALVSSKSSAWEYEHEIRFLYDVKQHSDQVFWRDDYNNPVIRISKEAIRNIYVGRRVSDSDLNLLHGILMEQGLDKQINVQRVYLSRTGYRLEVQTH